MRKDIKNSKMGRIINVKNYSFFFSAERSRDNAETH
jgi:hypothetical protein